MWMDECIISGKAWSMWHNSEKKKKIPDGQLKSPSVHTNKISINK